MPSIHGKKKPGAKSAKKQSGTIRVIAGKWRGRKLPVADSEGLRPTTDRTKETLFNWLMQDVAGSVCLDLFAGSGSLAVEALSRHARKAVLIEKLKDVAKNLNAIAQTLQLSETEMQVVNADALQWLQNAKEDPFDLVFVDPPFHKNLLEPAINGLIDMELLQNRALIYVEHEIELAWSIPESFSPVKQKDTQQVASRLFEYCPD
jgi:16S rRNA (guanine966-N2)-methyltransferase